MLKYNYNFINLMLIILSKINFIFIINKLILLSNIIERLTY